MICADRAGIDERLVAEIVGHVAALGAGDDGQALGRGFFAGGDDRAGADRIDGHRFFDEAMFAGFHRGGEMQRPEGRRRGHQDVVAIGGDHFLIGVKAAEATIRRRRRISCRRLRPCP